MKAIMPAIILLGSVSPAYPDSKLASELAMILASEELCGFEYSEEAIDQYISENVDPSEIGFAAALFNFSRSAERRFAKIDGSRKVAHCAAVANTARHYGFLK